MSPTPFNNNNASKRLKMARNQTPPLQDVLPVGVFGLTVTLVFDQLVVVNGLPACILTDDEGLEIGPPISMSVDESGTQVTLDFGIETHDLWFVSFPPHDPAIRTRLGQYVTPAAIMLHAADGGTPLRINQWWDAGTQRLYVQYDRPISLVASVLTDVRLSVWGLHYTTAEDVEVTIHVAPASPNTVYVQAPAPWSMAPGDPSRITGCSLSDAVVAAFGGAAADDIDDEAFASMVKADDPVVLLAVSDAGESSWAIGFNTPIQEWTGGSGDIAFVDPTGVTQVVCTGATPTLIADAVLGEIAMNEPEPADGPAQTCDVGACVLCETDGLGPTPNAPRLGFTYGLL